jgi:hypothetical protein
MDGITAGEVPWLAAAAQLPTQGEESMSKRVLVFGGVMSGGYTFDCNDLYALVRSAVEWEWLWLWLW